MDRYGRREFLVDVGRGMLVASVGSALAQDLGLAPAALAEEGAKGLTFGALEPLVDLMQETPADRILPAVVARMKAGTDLRPLVAAAALANARAFGGQDYDGYHALMALAPAYHMAQEMPESQRALPVLKVIYRNTNHIQQAGCGSREAIRPVDPSGAASGAESLREAERRQDMDGAERAFAATMRGPLDEAYNDLQYLVQDHADVHRVVLAWRAWALLDLTGKEHAHTLLRQSVRYCVDQEANVRKYKTGDPLRALLPRLLDQYKLLARPEGDRRPDDAWIDGLARTIYASDRSKAADAVAAALADGIAPESIGEAISLAANQLVLHDPGRKKEEPGKPKGSVHGASVGVHASDSANAWRNIARVSNRRNAARPGLIVGAYHTAGQAGSLNPKPYPLAEHRESVRDVAASCDLIAEAESAIKANDQSRACALIHRHGESGGAERPAFDLLLRYATSEDGALHAEKYYRTVTEEFASTRPAFRWRHLAALARVTASEHGHPAARAWRMHEEAPLNIEASPPTATRSS